jgi:hydrogenase maturation protein HypF
LLRDVGRPLVMTSGNLSEEPIARDNDEALRRLAHLADHFLLHNRDIYARYDDSVWFVPRVSRFTFHVSRFTSHASRPNLKPETLKPETLLPQPIRRSRGYAPFPVKLPFKVRPILACGAELKNTFCVTRDEYAFLSQHIGDMENLETLEHFETSVSLYEHLFRVEPEAIAYDLHPDYFATKYAWRTAQHLPRIGVQHHHAHIAACLVDNDWPPDGGPVIGVAWDGTGYGLDGQIWGGEFFVGDYHGFRRAAHLEYLPMPGGDAAIRNPWRLALGYLYVLTGGVPPLPGVSDQELRIARQQVDRDLNTPLTSAVGRLFDAVAALVGVRQRVTYEAQAAIEFEMMATRWGASQGGDKLPAYPFAVIEGDDGASIRLGRLLEAIQADLAAGASPAQIGWRFHRTMAEIIGSVCQRIAGEAGLQVIALSGGVFQNRLLLALTVPLLEEAGFRVLLHCQAPCNDGGLSLGQAALAQFALDGGGTP